MKSTTLLAICPDGRTTTLEFSDRTVQVDQVLRKFEEKEGVPSALQSLRFVGGNSCEGWVDLQSVVSVRVNLRLCGGKGGFGALLRSEARRTGNTTRIFNPARNAQAAKRQKVLSHCLSQRKQGEVARMIFEAKRPRDGEMTLKEEAALDHIRQHRRDGDLTSDGIHSALLSVTKGRKMDHQPREVSKESEDDEFDFLRDDYLIPLEELSDECFSSDEGGDREDDEFEEGFGGGECGGKSGKEECEEEEEIVWVPVEEEDYDEMMN